MTTKMYICVRDDVDSFMVPTLVAHTILIHHMKHTERQHLPGVDRRTLYTQWLQESFKKVVLKVNKKEWAKIVEILDVTLGYEKTQLNGAPCCAILPPMSKYPRVIQFAKTWTP